MSDVESRSAVPSRAVNASPCGRFYCGVCWLWPWLLTCTNGNQIKWTDTRTATVNICPGCMCSRLFTSYSEMAVNRVVNQTSPSATARHHVLLSLPLLTVCREGPTRFIHSVSMVYTGFTSHLCLLLMWNLFLEKISLRKFYMFKCYRVSSR